MPRPVSSPKRRILAPRFRLVESQILRQQLVIYANNTVLWAGTVSPIGHQGQAIWRCSLELVTKIWAPDDHIIFLLDHCFPLLSGSRAEGEHQDGIHSLCSLRAAPWATKCVQDRRVTLQAEALGKAKG